MLFCSVVFLLFRIWNILQRTFIVRSRKNKSDPGSEGLCSYISRCNTLFYSELSWTLRPRPDEVWRRNPAASQHYKASPAYGMCGEESCNVDVVDSIRAKETVFVFASDVYHGGEMCSLRCFSPAKRNMFNDIIVWASARACFKLLMSFICQPLKVVCVGWVSNSSCWLMEKKKRRGRNHALGLRTTESWMWVV